LEGWQFTLAQLVQAPRASYLPPPSHRGERGRGGRHETDDLGGHGGELLWLGDGVVVRPQDADEGRHLVGPDELANQTVADRVDLSGGERDGTMG
jgi:hypothetical protein